MKSIRVIYLAGGNSRRFPCNKLLYEYEGRPLFYHGLGQLLKLNVDIFVVSQYLEVLDQIKENVHKVYSPLSKEGISYSIQAGIKADPSLPDYYLFMVADQPYIKAHTIERLIKETVASNVELSCLSYNGTWYNPCMVSSAYVKDLLSLKKDQGGKKILRKYADRVKAIDIFDRCEIEDIDYLSDIKK